MRNVKVAAELKVVIPVCFFERAGNKAFNSVAMIDADGSILGVYHKTHIPDGVPYAEKFYFTPGDTGFIVWNTAYAKIAEANRTDETVLVAEFDLDAIALKHRQWGVFRDRRPEMYQTLLTHGEC